MQTLSAILARTARLLHHLAHIRWRPPRPKPGRPRCRRSPGDLARCCAPDFRISDGLVVTPSSSRRSLSSRISFHVGSVDEEFHGRPPRRCRWQRGGLIRSAFALDQIADWVTGHEARSTPTCESRCRCWCRCQPTRAYTYAVPDGMAVAPGSIVRVPLGPREVAGIVWDDWRRCGRPAKLRPISHAFDCPPIATDMRRFVDWVVSLHAVAAGHGGAHAAAGAGSLRPGAAGRGPGMDRRSSRTA